MRIPAAKKYSSSGAALSRYLLPAILLIALLWLGGEHTAIAAARTPAGLPAANATDQRATQIPIPLFLETPLDSKKRAAGDQVQAIVASQVDLSDGSVIPRESKVTGHIVESKARSKGDSESSIAIVFDKIDMPNGKTMNIKGSLRAIAPNPNPDENGGGVDYGSSINRSLEHAGPGQTSYSSVPILNAESEGAIGMKDLSLASDGVIRSTGKAVKLGRGIQVMIRAELLGQ